MKETKLDRNGYCVYVHRCKANRKRYVGKTRQRLDLRFQNGLGYHTQLTFYADIQKYGWDGFEHITIAHGLSEETAQNLEWKLIDYYDTTNPQKGYNTVSKDGYTRQGYSERHKKIIRDVVKTDAWKKNHLEAMRELASNPKYKEKMLHINRARAKTDSWRSAFEDGMRKRSESSWKENHRGATQKLFSTAVCCFSVDGDFIGEFPSYVAAHNATGVSKSGICSACNGKYKTAGGYVWKKKKDCN